MNRKKIQNKQEKQEQRFLPHKTALGLINKPEKSINEKQTYDRIACVFQGGGALGAYQVGAFRAIHEQGYRPNYLAGVSIGAINCAIIAGNPPEKQVEKLLEFWYGIAPQFWHDNLIDYSQYDILRHFHNQMGAMYSLFFGLEGFFLPRFLLPTPFTSTTPDHLSYYDTKPLRETLEKLIDFDRLNDKDKTICLGAVNITSGEMEFFNNQKITITADHVLASGALPPGFPAVKIDGDYYWDGGIYANTPLMTVLDALPEQDTLCFVVDCFSLKGNLPKTLDELDERQKDIRYASHSRRMTNVYASRQNLQNAIKYLSDKLTPEAKKDPTVQQILALSHEKRFSVVHIIYRGTPFTHSFKDYNFVRSAIDSRMEVGYNDAVAVLANPEWEKKTVKKLSCSIYGVTSNYYDQH